MKYEVQRGMESEIQSGQGDLVTHWVHGLEIILGLDLGSLIVNNLGIIALN